MLCTVYRSNKKAGVYLYLAREHAWEDLPEDLINTLGECEVAMHLDLTKREKLASEDIVVVRKNLQEQGYHLQLPPKLNTQVINYG
jgi:uncharacterized protein YcgL (UPF0745 family)